MTICNTPSGLLCASNVFYAQLVSSEFLKSQCYPRCPLECFSAEYNGYASYVQFNADLYMDVVRNRANFLSIYDNQTLSDQAIRSGLTKVSFYYDELSYTEITEAPAMNQVALMAAIGFMGMFLGMSFMTLVESVDIVFRIVLQMISNNNF